MIASAHTVMVVEDDEGIRSALCDLLVDEGWEVICVENGQVALDRLKNGIKPCLILLDLMMPVMDGWRFQEEQQKDPELSHIPVVVITAAGIQPSEMKVKRILPKPLKLEAVLGAVQEFC